MFRDTAARRKMRGHIWQSYLDILGFKLPLEVAVEGGCVDAAWDVDALCQLIDVFQWTLDTCSDTQSHDSC